MERMMSIKMSSSISLIALAVAIGAPASALNPPRSAAARQIPSSIARAQPVVRPVVIQIGGVAHAMTLSTLSPYYGAPFSANSGKLPPLTYDEVDYWNSAAQYFSGGAAYGIRPPLGVDHTTVVIDPKEADFGVNFRYASAEKNVTAAIWQISRFPFANDPAHWQGQYIPGFVASGTATDFHVDNEGYHYFKVNFARVASRAPGAPPYYEGMVSMPAPGRGVSSFVTNPARLSPPPAAPARRTMVPFGTAVAHAPPGALGRRVFIPPGLRAANSDRLIGLAPSPTDQDQVFYLRVIPMHAGNQAGIPAIPVTVTVKRPRPCPTYTQTTTVRPPTVKIVWYMQPIFYNAQTSTGHWYVVNGAQSFLPNSLHMLDPPPQPDDKTWYEKIVDDFDSIVNFFSEAMSDISMMWNGLEDELVKVAATMLSYTLTGGIYRCDKDSSCTDVLLAAGQAVMAAYGIPPTLPTGPELLDMSTDYLIRVGADELGAGSVLEAYQSLPPEVRSQMQAGAKDAATVLVQQQNSAVQNAMANAECVNVPAPFQPGVTRRLCPTRIPDPIFNAVHPATVMLYFENTNNVPTDPVTAKVTDSRGLYKTGSVRIPSLPPGEHTSVPVLLEEETDQFLDISHGPCPSEDGVTVSGTSCQQQRWFDKFYQLGTAYQSPKVSDTFRVTFSVMNGVNEIGGLDERSSGHQLSSMFVIDAGSMCSIQGYLAYPQGWNISTSPRSVMADAWDNLFSQGPNDPGNPNNGMLRTQ
jgi:hypothetical protein